MSGDELYAFGLEPEALFEGGFSGQKDLAACAYDAMPRDIGSAIVKRPDNLSCGSLVTCCRGNLAVGHDLASRDTPDYVAEFVELHFAPVTSLSFAKKLFLRSVSSPQLTGGDWYPSGSK
jgi:hypothetical protein